ncbi:hypothetical protein JTB14_033727 [Gonioctena quinquepunctata]|nr:hypothetical protein JTB14_033727 [Gonioctena quinquepunctata]
MKKLLSREVALLHSGTEAVRKRFTNATDSEINKSISLYLAGAADREGGRKNRYLDKYENCLIHYNKFPFISFYEESLNFSFIMSQNFELNVFTFTLIFFRHYENKNTRDKKENSTNDPEKTTRTNVDFKFRCHKIGHKAIDCRYRNRNNFSQNTSQAEEAYTVEPITIQETVLMTNFDKDKGWCLDSGCTSHMSSELENFKDLKTFKRTLNLANNFSTEIEGIGEISVPVSEEKSLLLRNTLHVPDLRTNLMSVSKITDRGHEVHFKKKEAFILSENKEIVAVANRIGRDVKFINQFSGKNNYEDFLEVTFDKRIVPIEQNIGIEISNEKNEPDNEFRHEESVSGEFENEESELENNRQKNERNNEIEQIEFKTKNYN